jgi:hypothetical protein
MILMLFEEQHRRESPNNARLSVFCLRYKQSQIIPVYVSFEGFHSPDQAGLMTESSSLNSYLWKLIPGFELRLFSEYTVQTANRLEYILQLKHSTFLLQ